MKAGLVTYHASDVGAAQTAKQPSPYELGCLLIVVSAVD